MFIYNPTYFDKKNPLGCLVDDVREIHGRCPNPLMSPTKGIIAEVNQDAQKCSFLCASFIMEWPHFSLLGQQIVIVKQLVYMLKP